MSHSLVIHKRDQKAGDVYVGRGSSVHGFDLGNKWSHLQSSKAEYKTESLGESIQKHLVWFELEYRTNPKFKIAVDSLRGKRLACYCAPNPCHADVIAEYANKLTLTPKRIESCGCFCHTLPDGSVRHITNCC